MKKLTILLMVLALGIGIYAFANRAPAPDQEEAPVASIPAGEPTFAWTYASSEEEGIPYSRITLSARYPDGTARTKEIDTIAGGCNEYEKADADTYAKSQMIICYYAGLGHYYKVVQADGAYLVKRKVFEEASPDYAPPQQQFETIAQF